MSDFSPLCAKPSFALISGADFRSHHGRLSIASPVIIIAHQAGHLVGERYSRDLGRAAARANRQPPTETN